MPATAVPGRFIGHAIAASAVLCPAAFAQSITRIGVLAGQTTSFAFSLSDDGRVVVGHSGDRAIRWTSDIGIQDLGVLAGQSNSAATSVSSDGNTIVGSSGTQAFRWTSSTGMQSVFSASGSLGSSALDVSADGSVIAGYRGFDAFAWSQSDGGQVILPDAQARGVSADGSTFVGHSYSTGHAYRWSQATGLELLVAGAGAEDISSDGSTMVGWVITGEGQRGFVSKPGFSFTVIPGLIGSTGAYAHAISDTGVVVGGDGNSAGQRAILWTAATGTQLLSHYLSLRGVDLSGWTSLNAALGVSSDGRFVVGYGTYGGSQQAFIADISESPPCAVADLFADGVVNGADLGILLSQWGPASANTVSDLNRDGSVDGADLGYLLNSWGPCAH